MHQLIHRLKQEVTNVLGITKEALEDECETTSSFVIASLYPRELIKVQGFFQEKGHFWVECDGEIIDLATEQFDVPFSYPLSSEQKNAYVKETITFVTKEIYEEAVHLANISDFKIGVC